MFFFYVVIALVIFWWVYPDDSPRLRRSRRGVTIRVNLGMLNKVIDRLLGHYTG